MSSAIDASAAFFATCGENAMFASMPFRPALVHTADGVPPKLAGSPWSQ
jgi:hypothetical protein